MENEPLISIVIPVYKIKEEYLCCCMDSCLAQTYDRIEVILVDDGSPDRCGAICDEFAAVDSRVQVVHQPNSGVSAARNAGIARATGDWITFLDADDYFEPDACQRIVEAIQNKPKLDLVVFSLVKDYKDRQIPNQSLYEGDRYFAGEEALGRFRRDVLETQLDSNTLRMTFCKAIKTSILREHGVLFRKELPLCEDVVFWFEAVQYVTSAYYVDKCLYHYRQVTDSATVKYRPNVVREHELLLQNLRQIMEKTECPDAYLHGYSLEAFYSMQRMITQGFYHDDNPLPAKERAKECRAVLGTEEYRRALKRIDTAVLTRNHKIKYWMLRMKFYGGLNLLRNLFSAATGRSVS